MREWQSQSHVKWYCRYHVVFTPKYRKRAIFGSLRKGIGKILRELCEQEKVELVEGHALSDHVHLCLSIPPKYSVANTIEREVGDPDPPRVPWEEAKLYGLPFLGARVLREHGRSGRRGDTRLHSEPRGRGKASGAARIRGALAPFILTGGPFEGPSSNHPLCGW